jgi:pantoate--beta-alanine ligase
VHILRTPQELSRSVDTCRANGQSVAMVPTMGALHQGHASLFKIAHEHADVVVATIFVNPLQFNNSADFQKYPLQMDYDVQLLEEHGVHFLYAPTVDTMYDSGFSTSVSIDGITDLLEGASRPGHFSGVATVVTKLFSAGRPDVAVFGQKDFQQFAVIQRLVADLDMPIRLIMAPTIREEDGLAMSSRNVRLSRSARQEAVAISQGLLAAQDQFALGSRESKRLVESVVSVLAPTSAEIDYVKLVDAKTLQDATTASKGSVIVVAVVLDDVRLIDNLVLE